MADWTPNPAMYGVTGNGTNLTPERWIKTYFKSLEKHEMWSQFVNYVAGPENFFEKGVGDTTRVNFIGKLDVPSASLTQGTKITAGTQASVQVSLTVAEEGNLIDISGLQSWYIGSPLVQTAVDSCVDNALETNDKRIGATYAGATSYFSIYGTDAFYENLHTGTRGTELFLPIHARLISQRMKRLGIAPMSDGYYHAVGQPGAWEAMLQQSSFVDNAARLGNATPFTKGIAGVYGGIVFHDELGANASMTYSATVGTSVIFGADACIGGNDINRPDLLTYYPDPDNDAKRTSRVTWYNRQSYALTLQGTLTARTFLIYHKM